jgi:DNA-binding ferritin-like protein (Dps family)
MRYRTFYKKYPEDTFQTGDVELDNFDLHKHLVKHFPEGQASISQIKEVLPPDKFKEFCNKTDTIYIGVND